MLSLLSSIESTLALHEPVSVATRSVDYRHGVARMSFANNGGQIVLQNHLLADGQLCVRVELHRCGAGEPAVTAIYPQRGSADWSAGVERVADLWFAEPAQGGESEALSA